VDSRGKKEGGATLEESKEKIEESAYRKERDKIATKRSGKGRGEIKEAKIKKLIRKGLG